MTHWSFLVSGVNHAQAKSTLIVLLERRLPLLRKGLAEACRSVPEDEQVFEDLQRKGNFRTLTSVEELGALIHEAESARASPLRRARSFEQQIVTAESILRCLKRDNIREAGVHLRTCKDELTQGLTEHPEIYGWSHLVAQYGVHGAATLLWAEVRFLELIIDIFSVETQQK